MRRKSGRWLPTSRRWTMPVHSPFYSLAQRRSLQKNGSGSSARRDGHSECSPVGKVRRGSALQAVSLSTAKASAATRSMSPDPGPGRSSERRVGHEAGLPECDFVYFATPACGSWTITAEFVDSAKAIIAHAYNSLGLRMPLVQGLRPGHQILLVHGAEGKYIPVFRCEVCASPEPVCTGQHTFDVFCCIPEEFHERLRLEGYSPDPVIQRFIGISISSVQDLRDRQCKIVKPKGNNTLRRWDEVFPRAACTNPGESGYHWVVGGQE